MFPRLMQVLIILLIIRTNALVTANAEPRLFPAPYKKIWTTITKLIGLLPFIKIIILGSYDSEQNGQTK